MKKLFLFPIIIIPYLLLSSVLSEIKYTISSENYRRLKVDDFNKRLTNGGSAEIEAKELNLLIQFSGVFDPTKIEIYINSNQLQNLYASGQYLASDNAFILPVGSFIKFGANEIKLIDYSQEGSVEYKWFFPRIRTAEVTQENTVSVGLVDEELKYCTIHKGKKDFGIEDFTASLFSNSKDEVELKGKQLTILIGLMKGFDPGKLQITINSLPFEKPFIYGEYLANYNSLILPVTDYLHEGLNDIVVKDYSADSVLEHRWNFKVGDSSNYGLVRSEIIPQQLTTGGYKTNIALSPDNRFVAYVMSDGKKNSIMISEIETGKSYVIEESKESVSFGLKTKKKEEYYSYAPCWSNSSEYIFYISSNTGHYEIYRAKIKYSGSLAGKPVRLSRFEANTTGLFIDPYRDILYFCSSKDDKKGIYMVENAEKSSDDNEFMSNVKEIISDKEIAFLSPSVSPNGKYLAYFFEPPMQKTKIGIIDLKSREIVYQTKSDDHENVSPAWSFDSEILAFYQTTDQMTNNLVITKPFSSNNRLHTIAKNIRLPETYLISPRWIADLHTIVYTMEDKNKSIGILYINPMKLEVVNRETILDDENYRSNLEVEITSDKRFLVYTTYQSGELDAWKIKLTTRENFTTCARFELPAGLSIEYYDREQEKYFPVGITPSIRKNSGWEFEGLRIGKQRFRIENEELYISLGKKIEPISDLKINKKVNYSYKPFLPGAGQKTKNQYSKSRLFFYPTIAMVGLAGANYYLTQRPAKDEYDKADNLPELMETKINYAISQSVTTGLATSAVMVYVFNILDAYFTNPSISKRDLRIHNNSFKYNQQNLKLKKNMEGKRDIGNGELKLFCKDIGTNIYLVDSKTKKKVFYGVSDLSNSYDVFFTISDIPPGIYTLVCEKPFKKPFEKRIKIEKFKTDYQIVGLANSSRLEKVFSSCIPGLVQYKKGEKIKGISLFLTTAYFTIAGINSYHKWDNALQDYYAADSVTDVFEARTRYYEQAKWTGFNISIASYLMVYNFIDAFTGD